MINRKPVISLVDRLKKAMEAFQKNALDHAEGGPKAAAARARKQITVLKDMLTEYRKVSIEVDKKA